MDLIVGYNARFFDVFACQLSLHEIAFAHVLLCPLDNLIYGRCGYFEK